MRGGPVQASRASRLQEKALLIADHKGRPPGPATRAPRDDITNGFLLELLVSSLRWEHSHAVWLEPELNAAPANLWPFDSGGNRTSGSSLRGEKDLIKTDHHTSSIAGNWLELKA